MVVAVGASEPLALGRTLHSELSAGIPMRRELATGDCLLQPVLAFTVSAIRPTDFILLEISVNAAWEPSNHSLGERMLRSERGIS